MRTQSIVWLGPCTPTAVMIGYMRHAHMYTQFAHLAFFNSEEQHVVLSFAEDVDNDDSDDDYWNEPLIMHHTIPLGVASPARGQRPM